MKKFIASMFVAAFVFVAGSSFAADSANLTIFVTVTESTTGIELLFGPDYFFGNMTVSASQIDGATGAEVRIFRNTGSGEADFQLQMGQWLDSGDNPLATQWTYLTTDPTVPTAADQVRIAGLWQLAVPALGDFLDNDTISTAAGLSDLTDSYALLATPAGEKGGKVASTGERTLHLLLQTPATGSANLAIPVKAVLTVTALPTVL